MLVTNDVFGKLAERDSLESAGKNEVKDTKKCLNCLRRIDVDFERCPHCRSGKFQFNDA